MKMSKTTFGLVEFSCPRLSVAADFAGLAGETATCPLLYILIHFMLDKFFLYQMGARPSRWMRQPMDDVKDLAVEGLRDERAWSTGADITEDGAAPVSEVDVLPLETGYGGAVGCSLRVVLLGSCYLIVVNSEVDRVYLHS